MKRWLVIAAILIVVIVALLLAGHKGERVIEVTKGKVGCGELILKVTSRGKIEAEERFELRAKIPGVLVSTLEEGNPVKKGQMVAILDDKELLAKQREQEALLIAHQSELKSLGRLVDLKEMKKRVDEKRVLFDEAQRQFLSTKALFEDKAASEDRFKQMKAEYEKAGIALDLALSQLDEAKDRHQERVETLQARINSTKANLAFIKQQIEWSRISSPADGIVIHKKIKEGTYVQPGQIVSVVASIDRFVVKTDLDEVDIAKIGLGMKAQALPDAFPGKTIPGVITRIAPSPLLQEKINTFEVTITLEKTDLPIRSEMLSDVLIISERKADVIKVPHEATLSMEDKTYVFVIEKDRAIKKEVVLGLRNPNEAEVLDGLDKDEEVILNPPLDLKDRTKIKIKKER